VTVPGILGRIVERTREDVQARRGETSRRELEERARERGRNRRNFAKALERRGETEPVRMICEVKKASPSKGILREDLDPRSLAAAYGEGGAAAVSVVTEPHFFRGRDEFLAEARAGAGTLPLLRKDFHVDELQVLEAASGEADAILLIVSVLSPTQLKDYLEMAAELHLGHLVEAADRKEAETALRAGARVVGVNNRDLTTFSVDLERTMAVLPLLRESGTIAVSESGIQDRKTVVRLATAGVHALLVGEALLTDSDPGRKLLELRGKPPGELS
jgi:indole-3-glycerol phosphate synthase